MFEMDFYTYCWDDHPRHWYMKTLDFVRYGIGKTLSQIGHDDLTKGEGYIHSWSHMGLNSGECLRHSLSP
jgi:hypothetical protein